MYNEIDGEPESIPENLRASCILHNICVEQHDSVEEFFRQMRNDVLVPRGDEPSPSVVLARDILANELCCWSIRD